MKKCVMLSNICYNIKYLKCLYTEEQHKLCDDYCYDQIPEIYLDMLK